MIENLCKWYKLIALPIANHVCVIIPVRLLFPMKGLCSVWPIPSCPIWDWSHHWHVGVGCAYGVLVVWTQPLLHIWHPLLHVFINAFSCACDQLYVHVNSTYSERMNMHIYTSSIFWVQAPQCRSVDVLLTHHPVVIISNDNGVILANLNSNNFLTKEKAYVAII